MALIDWQCAQGEPAPAVLVAASVVPIAPDDDSIDTNAITITGSGTINSFGPCSRRITKRVQYEIASPLTLVHSSNLVLLSLANRTISARAFGIYACGGNNQWIELYFDVAGSAGSVETRLQALEGKVTTLQGQVATMQGQVSTLQGQVATLQGQVNNHETRIAALEAAR